MHIALLGDSIFDNLPYVRQGEKAVIEHLSSMLSGKMYATLAAVDGDCTPDVREQLDDLPRRVTHLVVSVGGNDALMNSHLIENVENTRDLVVALYEPILEFRHCYEDMVEACQSTGLPLTVCTIYEDVPFPDEKWLRFAPLAIEAYNDVIRSKARQYGLGLIDLTEICTNPEDYSEISPIEPSHQGGQKIAEAIVKHLRLAQAPH